MKKVLVLSLALLVMCLFTLPALAGDSFELGSYGGAYQGVTVTIMPINENIAISGDATAGNLAITAIRSCTLAGNSVNANTNANTCGNDGIDDSCVSANGFGSDTITASSCSPANAAPANASACAVALSCNSVSNHGVANANSGDAIAIQCSPSNTVGNTGVIAVGGINLELPCH